MDSADGSLENRPAVAPATTAEFRQLGDRMGRVPVLEYHVVTDSSAGLFVRRWAPVPSERIL